MKNGKNSCDSPFVTKGGVEWVPIEGSFGLFSVRRLRIWAKKSMRNWNPYPWTTTELKFLIPSPGFEPGLYYLIVGIIVRHHSYMSIVYILSIRT